MAIQRTAEPTPGYALVYTISHVEVVRIGSIRIRPRRNKVLLMTDHVIVILSQG